MKILGHHLIVEYSGCDQSILDNQPLIEEYLKEAARKSGATIVQSVMHRYNPQGISGVVVIAESHLSIHTWPEYGYAAVDFFTCGESVDPYKAHEYMQKMLKAKMADVRDLNRGMPSPTNEIISHKPAAYAVASKGI